MPGKMHRRLPLCLALVATTVSLSSAQARVPARPRPRIALVEVSIFQHEGVPQVWLREPESEIAISNRFVLLDTAGVVGVVVVSGPPVSGTWPTVIDQPLRATHDATVWGVSAEALIGTSNSRALLVDHLSSQSQPDASRIAGVDRSQLRAAIDRNGDGLADLVLLASIGRNTSSRPNQICRDHHSTVRVRGFGTSRWRTVRHVVTNKCEDAGCLQSAT